jgi:hypothetical protein
MPAPSTPKRKPAARPANRNAFRRGLYSNTFTQAEMQRLDEKEESDLLFRIALTRLILSRLVSKLNVLKERNSSHA